MSGKDILREFKFAAEKIEEHLLKPTVNLTLEDLGFGVPAYSEDQKAVYTASASITALKAADAITLADKDAVTAARAAYDKLTDAQKKLMPAATLKKLTDAEAKIAALEKAKKESEKAAAKKAAKAVVKGKTYTVKTLKYKVTRADMKGRGTVTLTGTTKKKTKLTKLTVPKTVKINGAVFKVTAIGNKAFNRFTKIRTVTMSNGELREAKTAG